MDRNLRQAEHDYLSDPGDPQTLFHYWSARARVKLPLELTQLQPFHSCDPSIEILILQNNDLVTIHGIPLARVREHIQQTIFEVEASDYPLLREGEQNTIYMGWMPNLFDLSHSQDQDIRDQVSAPGLLVLSYMGPHRHFVTRKAYYFSIYLGSYDPAWPFTADIESVADKGEDELEFIHEMSCTGPLVLPNADVFPQARLVGRRHLKPLTMVHQLPPTINELFDGTFGELDHDELSPIYIPIIDIDATSYYNRYNIYEDEDL